MPSQILSKSPIDQDANFTLLLFTLLNLKYIEKQLRTGGMKGK
jgi:hypothetical protein